MPRLALILVGVVAAHLAALAWMLRAPAWMSAIVRPAEPVAVTVLPDLVAAPKPAPSPTTAAPAVRRPAQTRPAIPTVAPRPAPAEQAQVDSAAPAVPESASKDSAGPQDANAGAAVDAPIMRSDPVQTSPPAIPAEAPVNPPLEVPVASSQVAADNDGTTLGLGTLKSLSIDRQFRYTGYLNGSPVATGVYKFESNRTSYRASFRVQATGITAWLWRGAREDSSEGLVGDKGLQPQRMRQQQGERPPREREVPAGALDLVSIVFQMSELGRNFPERFVAGFSARVRVQKNSRVDILRVQVLADQMLTIAGKQVRSVPVELSEHVQSVQDANPAQNSTKQTIWFVPEMDWAPMRLSVPTGNYQVEFRAAQLSPIETQRESP